MPHGFGFHLVRRTLRRVAIVGVFAGVLGGCAAPARGPDEPPPDFALGLSVRGEARTPLAPAWYILDADGVLRAGLGVRHEGTPAPVPVRTLRADERAEVWRLAAALDSGGMRVAPTRTVPAPGEAVIHLSRDGRRRTYLVADVGTHDAVARLAAGLAALAWAPGPRQPQIIEPASGTASMGTPDATIDR